MKRLPPLTAEQVAEWMAAERQRLAKMPKLPPPPKVKTYDLGNGCSAWVMET